MKTALQTLALIAALGMTNLAAWSQQNTNGQNSPIISGNGNVVNPATKPTLAQENKMVQDASLKRDLAITKVKLAIANAQLAQNNAQATQSASQQAVVQAQQLIEQTRIELGLDDTYAWDFQKQDYVKKFVPPATPPPAKK